VSRGHWLVRRPYPDFTDWLALACGMLVCALIVAVLAAVR